MSWSIGFIGTTKNVITALKDESAKLSGQSKEEYDSALPHLIGMVEQNFEKGFDPVVKITANGHGYAVDGALQSGTLQMQIERFYGTIV